MLKTLKDGAFRGLLDGLGEEGVSRADLMAVGSSSSERCTDNLKQLHRSSPLKYMYTRKLVRIMSLPPTDVNLLLHVKRVHFQMLLWKAADHMGSLDVSISEYGLEIKDGIIIFVLVSIKPTVAVTV